MFPAVLLPCVACCLRLCLPSRTELRQIFRQVFLCLATSVCGVLLALCVCESPHLTSLPSSQSPNAQNSTFRNPNPIRGLGIRASGSHHYDGNLHSGSGIGVWEFGPSERAHVKLSVFPNRRMPQFLIPEFPKSQFPKSRIPSSQIPEFPIPGNWDFGNWEWGLGIGDRGAGIWTIRERTCKTFV